MFQKITQWFKQLFNKIQANQQVQEFEDFLKQVFTAEKALLIASLKDFALSAVQTASKTGLDNEYKRQQAIAEVTAKAQTAGLVFGASAIALAVEMAVQAFKNNNQGIIDGKSN